MPFLALLRATADVGNDAHATGFKPGDVIRTAAGTGQRIMEINPIDPPHDRPDRFAVWFAEVGDDFEGNWTRGWYFRGERLPVLRQATVAETAVKGIEG